MTCLPSEASREHISSGTLLHVNQQTACVITVVMNLHYVWQIPGGIIKCQGHIIDRDVQRQTGADYGCRHNTLTTIIQLNVSQFCRLQTA
jgi:hypothetical protein